MNSIKNFGKLYICATPIGNIEDITIRTLKILKNVDLIAAEDTRVSIKLLNYYNIHTKMISYHKYNAKTRNQELLEKLKEGNNVALISDAGMPCISDPGNSLIKILYDNNINVEVLPGAVAFITGIVKSGFNTDRLVFDGFLPTNVKKRKQILKDIINEKRTVTIYEAPHRLLSLLKELSKVIGDDRKICIAKELTKKYEDIVIGTISEVYNIYVNKDIIKGEYVIIIQGLTDKQLKIKEQEKWENISFEDHVKYYSKLQDKEIIKRIASDKNMNKRDVYNKFVLYKKNNKMVNNIN